MKIRIDIVDSVLATISTHEIPLDERSSVLLARNVNSRECPAIKVTLVHDEHLATIVVPPGERPG